ncbi:ABC transporter permease [Paenibacillus nanensis]|uniref:ABC transporter permease n=1 Tax=Paenibacillus nanensis TaxID=393251 RepID=A0A3A1URC4_9BACL|nr:ABC transporter permease [Paenibacillus nanensis]RIX50794.1 ABC transporter permease [Paenibacillus nanensis]
MAILTALAHRLVKQKLIWPLLAIAALFLFNLIVIPEFYRMEWKDGHLYGNLIDILKNGSPLIIIAIGMTLVIAKEGIDISVGSVLAISGALAVMLLDSYPLWAVIGAGLTVGLLCGLWNGMLVALLGIQPMVATLILLTIGRGIAQLITGGQVLTTSDEAFQFIGKGHLLGLPFPIFIALGVFLLTYLFKTRTAFGLFLEAAGGNKTASAYAGIRPKVIFMTAYAITGVCAGIAGIIISSNVASADANNAGLWIELDAILAVVIGGTSMRGGRFYLGGTIAGTLFIQALTTSIYSLGVEPSSILLVKAIVVIIVCLIQSDVFRQSFILSKKKVAQR